MAVRRRIVESSGDNKLDADLLAMIGETEFTAVRLVDDPMRIVGCVRDEPLQLRSSG